MQRSKIEWTDFSINPVKGACPRACPYCYARRMYNRFGWDKTIRFVHPAELGADKIPDGSRVFMGSTIDLFGPWVTPHGIRAILEYCQGRPGVTWQFLTKFPERARRYEFPPNTWAGVTVTGPDDWQRMAELCRITGPSVKFVSFEPLLGWFSYFDRLEAVQNISNDFRRWGVRQVITGQQTPPKAATSPQKDWIADIVQAAEMAWAKVFLKNNLRSLFRQYPPSWAYRNGDLRQELPERKE